MSFYQSLLDKISLLEHQTSDRDLQKSHMPWYLNVPKGGKPRLPWFVYAEDLPAKLKLRYYKTLLALVRIWMIIRGVPSSNFWIFTQAGKDGVYICNYTYCYYKSFHKKTKWKFLAMVTASTIIVSLIVALIFPGKPYTRAASPDWQQGSWADAPAASAGACTALGGTWNAANSKCYIKPDKKTGWTSYDSKDANVSALAGGVSLTETTSSYQETSDTDFNAGTVSQTVVSGTGSAANISLINVPPYFSSGTFTSQIKDLGTKVSSWGTLNWNDTLNGGTVALRARSCNDAACAGETAIASCTAIAKGANISTGGCVNVGDRYIQYQAALSTPNNTLTPAFSDVTIGFNYYPSLKLDLSNAGGGGWASRRPITITGSTAGELTGYQVLVNFTSALGSPSYDNINADGSDIRFTNSSGAELPYWIQTWSDGGNSAVWVKVDTIPASPSATTIYMYYNNANAVSSSNQANAIGTGVVAIGTQIWASANLNIGTGIAGATSMSNNGTVEKWCYNDTESNCTAYGGLYIWDEVMGYITTEGAQGICPSGFHIPADPEWYTLENYLKDNGQTCSASRSGTYDCVSAGTKLKTGGSSGFEAFLGGTRSAAGTFNGSTVTGYFQSSTNNGGIPWIRLFISSQSGVSRNGFTPSGYSVRCIKGVFSAPSVGSLGSADNFTLASLASSPYDTENDGAVINTISWAASNVSGTNKVKFQTRTAPNLVVGSLNTPNWASGSGWCGPSSCAASTGETDYAGSFFQTTPAGEQVNNKQSVTNSDGISDQWIQYKIWLESDGSVTPTLTSATINYSSNSAPCVGASFTSDVCNFDTLLVSQTPNTNIVTVTTAEGGFRIIDQEESPSGTGKDLDQQVSAQYFYDVGLTTPGAGNSGNITITADPYSVLPATNGYIMIDDEVIKYDSKSGNILTVTTGRGTWPLNAAVYSTRPVSHAAGATVYVYAPSATGTGVGAISNVSVTNTVRYSASLDLVADLPDGASGLYLTNAEVRVALNDGNAAKQVGTSTYSNLTIDTKNPAGSLTGSVPAKIDSVNSTISFGISTDAGNTTRVRLSGSSLGGVACTAGTPAWQTLPISNSYTFSEINTNFGFTPVLSAGSYTIYWQFADDYCNMITGSAITPLVPDHVSITDISALPITKYRTLVWWDVVSDATQYNLWRCVQTAAEIVSDPNKCSTAANFSLFNTIVAPAGATNYCFDEGDGDCAQNSANGALVNDSKYHYKVTAEKSDGLSSFSIKVDAIPNGSTIGEVDITPPVVTYNELTQGPKESNTHMEGSTSVPNLTQTTASFAFSASENAFFSVKYEPKATEPADNEYTMESGAPSWIGLTDPPSIGTVTIRGLQANTKYYYRVRARDLSGNIGEASVYSFTTLRDITPPVITFNPATGVSISSSQAAITWTTDESSASQVSYGLTSSYELTPVSNSSLDINHNIIIPNLSPATKYYFKIISTDAASNPATDDNSTNGYTFTTLPEPPTISAVKCQGISATNACAPSSTQVTISWTTNQNSSSYVDFGPDLKYGATQSNAADAQTMTKNHSVTLIGLEPNTSYKYRVKSINATGDTSANDNSGQGYAFTTGVNSSLGTASDFTISSVAVNSSSITATSATVSWTTSDTADAVVGYSVNDGYSIANLPSYSFESGDASPATIHNITLTGLSPSTTYVFRLRSRNSVPVTKTAISATTGVDPLFSFTTLAGVDLVAPIITLTPDTTVISSTGATIYWETNKPASSLVDLGTVAGDYTLTFSSPATSSRDFSTRHTVSLTGLAEETPYFYRVRSVDLSSNQVADDNSGAGYTFTTTQSAGSVVCPACRSCVQESCPVIDISAPIISNIKISDIAFSSVTITWTTDEVSNSAVSYDVYSYDIKGGYAYANSKLKDATQSHSITLSNLDSASTYYFRVLSSDPRGNTGESADQSFKTPAISESKDKGAATSASLKKEFEEIAKTLVKDNLATEENIKDILSRITNPPIIGSEGPLVKDIKSYGATIVWQTDRKSNSIVKFTAAESTDSLSKLIGWKEIGMTNIYGTSHEVTLLGLAPSTDYSFQAQSQDILGNTSSSEIKSFTTAGASSIFNVSVTDLNLTSATITWETANISTSSLEYGSTSSYGNYQDNKDEKVRNHAVTLANLAPSSVFHFRVRSIEDLGTILVSDDYSFSTPSLPEITKYTLGEVKDNSIALAWTSNIPIDTNVRYTNVETNEVKNLGKEEKSLDHAILIADLEAGKTYKIEIQGRDDANNLATVPAFDVQTGMDIIPPEISQVRSQSAVLSTADDKVQSIISWKTNELSSTKVLWDLGGTKGDTLANETALDANLTTNHIVVLTQFKPGTVYRFRVASVDKFGNTTISSDYTVLSPVKRQSIIQMIINQFENIFGWAKGIGI